MLNGDAECGGHPSMTVAHAQRPRDRATNKIVNQHHGVATLDFLVRFHRCGFIPRRLLIRPIQFYARLNIRQHTYRPCTLCAVLQSDTPTRNH